MAARAILLVALAAFLLAGFGRADDTPKLTGSRVTPQDAFKKSDAVFIGIITGMGTQAPDDMDEPYAGPTYNGVEINVVSVLKGHVGPQASATLFVAMVPSEKESVPGVSGSYVFFVTKNGEKDPDAFTVLKLLPATDANIATVKKLISQSPKGAH